MKKLLIEVNQTCNLNCTYCFYRDYGRSSDTIQIKDIEKYIKKYHFDEFYLTGGECFTSKNIDEIIEYLHTQGHVYVFTNGIVLNKYKKDQFNKIVDMVDRFIITFDSFDFNDYLCRNRLNETLETIRKIQEIDSSKIEVKVCINNYNKNKLDHIFKNLISIGINQLSINFVFDINNSELKHEVIDDDELKKIFSVIYKYIDKFNKKYIDVLYELYINKAINTEYPCIADNDYYFLSCNNELLICPGNNKNLTCRGDYKNCFSKECANEWEIMYDRSE